MTSRTPRIACIGAGNIGRSWAVAFARGGAAVRLFDTVPAALERARSAIEATATDLEQMGRLPDKQALLDRIQVSTSLSEAIEGACHIQESVIDDLEVKRRVFRDLDAAAPDTVTIGSSSGELPVSKFTDELPGRGRCLLVHPVNPPHILRAVEICPTPWTDPWAVESSTRLVESLGMVPLKVSREINGYVINRLQYALIGEALHLVGAGYCEPADIDAALKHGLGLRWAFLGPFETSHLNASQGYLQYMLTDEEGARRLMTDVGARYPWNHALIEKIHRYLEASLPVSAMPAHQRERDRTLMSLMQRLQERKGES
ncbi:MAG: 3-hydroxyacyl-CoA dehydrogenase [Proteobacteria bacterium]|nr:3-hydroxyacyl-CoA dehydrogenase [Pseudomonadota bacterium]